MSLQTHLVELERKHRQLEEAIAQAVASPSSDGLSVVEMKRKKLLLKEEIERVRQTMPDRTLH
ncbi:MAG TPA: DUF465 domain-containing protein [Bosea sp. (in: a-proteobacteria)]|jgi:hypothetical protein|uniref:YdcH family protein n=1 Tax=Bosea sp. (in: a-proteobacteria) TaxID=1871050 RepID=UPI002E0ECA52|nr:DUF465 domain-containing protein [Bosea sp. (in: a-proteobacteria)]